VRLYRKDNEVMMRLINIAAIAALFQLVGADAFAQDKTEPEALKAVTEKIEEMDEKMERAGEALSKATESLEDASKSAGTGKVTKEVDPNLKAYLEYKHQKLLLDDGPSAPVEVLVPIASFAMIVLLVFLPLYLRNRKRVAEAEVQKKAIEAGLQFIPEIPNPPKSAHNDKRTGLLLAGIGIAAAVPIALFGYPKYAVFGLAFVFLGIAYFLAGKYLAVEEEK